MRCAAGTVGLPFLAALLLAGCVTTETAQKDYEAKVSEVVLAAAVEAEQHYDYANAARHFETLYERDKTNPKVIRDLARNLRYSGAPRQAVTLLKGSIKSLGRKPGLVLELAKAQLAASEIADAQDTLTAAQDLKSLSQNWQYFSVVGLIHDRLGKFSEAQEAYRHALELSPKNVAVLNNLALSYALSGKIDDGIKTLKEIADGENGTSLTRQNLALLYGVKGDMKAAERLVKRDLPKKEVEKNLKTYRDFRE